MTRVPYDPELAVVLEQVQKFIPTSLRPEMIPAIRDAFARAMPSLKTLTAGRSVIAEDRTIPALDDQPAVDITLFSPLHASSQTPAVFHLHGGGLVLGHRLSGSPRLIDLAEQLGIRIITVEYRLAPEHMYPAAVSDAHRAWNWTVENAAELGIDPERIILMGTSAGGGLAGALALRLRDEHADQPFGQMLLSPMLDDSNSTTSSADYDGVGLWDRNSNDTGWTAYLGPAPRDTTSPYASPTRAHDLSGLPPTFLDVGSSEVFRDEVTAYAARLWAAGNLTESHVWAGGFHGFDELAPDSHLARTAILVQTAWLERLLAATP